MDFLFLLLLGSYVSPLTCLWLAALVTLIPMGLLYKRAPIVKAEQWIRKEDMLVDVLCVAGVVLLGIGLNVLITHLPFSLADTAYENANAVLYSGGIGIKILCNVITVPILEELLYRGLICGQLEVFYHNRRLAIVISAFLFGALHMNMIQFMYALLCGLFLGYIYLKHHRIWVPIAAHGLTNLVVILYTVM